MPGEVKSAVRSGKATFDDVEKTVADMSKTATKSMDSAADAATSFAFPKFEVPETFRSFAEQSLSQGRETYSRMKAASEEATDIMEESMETARTTLRDVQFKALDAAKSHADASFDFARKLFTVTSMSDALQLQATFARERFEAMVDYSKDVQTSLGKVSTEAVKPAKTMFERVMVPAKAA